MNKKNSVIISVVVNAGLLSILFFAALTKKEDKIIPSSPDLVRSEISTELKDLHPLYEGFEAKEEKAIEQPFDAIAIKENKEQAVVKEVAQVKEEEKVEDKSVVYKLPELAVNEVQEKKIEETPILKKDHLLRITVKKGDNLEKLAKRYSTTVKEIRKINKIEGHLLKIGKELIIPQIKSVVTKKAEKTPSPLQKGEYYVVKRGDNPWTIAMKHHLKVEELLRLNNLDKAKARRLRPGDKLRIR